MKRFGAVFIALAAALAVTAGSALAAPIPGTLDQQQTDASVGFWMNMNVYRAQTFTAGATGTLSAVTIQTQVTQPNVAAPAAQLNVAAPAAAGDYLIEIWATSGGVPSGASALASETVVGDTGGLVVVAFSSPPSVVAGTQYAIRLVVEAGGEINWLGDCQSNPYAGGQALVFDVTGAATWQTVADWATANDSLDCALDFAFATYVTAAQATPQPTASVTPPPTSTPSPQVTPPPTSTPSPQVTPPPTSTGPLEKSHSDPAPLLIAVGLASAAALVTIRRYGLVRR
jgi:hypothetical protein